MTSPSARYQHSPGKGEQRPRPGRADRTLPGHRRSGSYQVTNAPAGGCRVLPPAPARRFGGKTRDLRSVRRRAKTGADGKTRPACARVAVNHQRTTLWMSHDPEPLARTNPGGSVRRGFATDVRACAGHADLDVLRAAALAARCRPVNERSGFARVLAVGHCPERAMATELPTCVPARGLAAASALRGWETRPALIAE